MRAVILAAGQGTRLEPITREVPKCLAEVAGVAIIDRLFAELERAGFAEAVVVTGYKNQVLVDHLAASPCPLARRAVEVYNPRFAEWGNFYSLLVAEETTRGEAFVKIDGDVLLDGRLLESVLAAPGPMCLAVDCRGDLGAEEMKVRVDDQGRMIELSKRIDPRLAIGEYVGVERIDAEAAAAVFAALRSLIHRGETDEYYERAYELMMQAGQPIRYADVSSCRWTEIDTVEDLRAAEALLARDRAAV
jgi:choline kinase